MVRWIRHNYPWAMLPLDWVVGVLVLVGLRLVRSLGPDRASDLGAFVAPRIGRFIKANRTGYANLKAAFPEKSEAEIQAILRGVWENLGRTACEYACMDDLWDFDVAKPNQGRIITDDVPLYERLRDDGKPAIFFAAHLANWEMPAVAAAAHGLDTTALYRMPNNRFVARAIAKIRGRTMGKMVASGGAGVLQLARELERNNHIGMLIDQHLARGVDVTFFGRPAKANPTAAKLAREFDCPVHGARVIRLPGNRFRLEATEELVLPRDADGRIDVKGAMQVMTDVVESWVRDHPEQWLWLHRRWR
ncbi:lipid A biosynthesis lauroyl acyltransferase [Phreatobacter sp. AB_2022a]|uniref:lipid A biosynthesis lauroyl acyltransferase n=1 Tax=Phreatobacter sp. AB_2022a TaxID=3003134 RepID=UPI002287489A|nr:lipid A biosynthesis lauroyl acyltransferase [Phreatobacter sp. AB_2022a]MCZ0737600.1 lipid A biosynthesis lauroyl acyltransferase [Phreatobacter sp. AB_2022a]